MERSSIILILLFISKSAKVKLNCRYESKAFIINTPVPINKKTINPMLSITIILIINLNCELIARFIVKKNYQFLV